MYSQQTVQAPQSVPPAAKHFQLLPLQRVIFRGTVHLVSVSTWSAQCFVFIPNPQVFIVARIQKPPHRPSTPIHCEHHVSVVYVTKICFNELKAVYRHFSMWQLCFQWHPGSDSAPLFLVRQWSYKSRLLPDSDWLVIKKWPWWVTLQKLKCFQLEPLRTQQEKKMQRVLSTLDGTDCTGWRYVYDTEGI